MKQVTQNTEFIIGIDFGHGETSAAFYDLKTQEKKDLDILPGLKVVKSAVAILEQEGKETISIGDAAIQNAPLAKDFQIAFKKRPSDMNETERGRMVKFMKGVYAEILNCLLIIKVASMLFTLRVLHKMSYGNQKKKHI